MHLRDAHYKYNFKFNESKIAPVFQSTRITQWALLDVAVIHF